MDLSELKYGDEIYYTGELYHVGRVERLPCVVAENTFWEKYDWRDKEVRRIQAWPFDWADKQIAEFEGCWRLIEFREEDAESVDPVLDSPKRTLRLFDLSPFSWSGEHVRLTATIRRRGCFQMVLEWEDGMSVQNAFEKGIIKKLPDESFELVDFPCFVNFSLGNPVHINAYPRGRRLPDILRNFIQPGSYFRVDLSDVRGMVSKGRSAK